MNKLRNKLHLPLARSHNLHFVKAGSVVASGLLLSVALPVLIASSQVSVSAAPSTAPPVSKISKRILEEEFQGDMNTIRAFLPHQPGGVESLDAVAQKICAKWLGKDLLRYHRISLVIAQQLLALDSKDGTSDALARKYALEALRGTDSMPLVIELNLTMCVLNAANRTLDTISDADFGTFRDETSRVSFAASNKLGLAMVPNYNSSASENLTSMNVVPDHRIRAKNNKPATTESATSKPLGGMLFSGMNPDLVSDPDMRAAYIEAIAENQRRKDRNILQKQLSSLNLQISPVFEDYLVAAYSKSPNDILELKKYLDSSEFDKNRKERIVDKAEAVMKERLEGGSRNPQGSFDE